MWGLGSAMLSYYIAGHWRAVEVNDVYENGSCIQCGVLNQVMPKQRLIDGFPFAVSTTTNRSWKGGLLCTIVIILIPTSQDQIRSVSGV